MSTTAGPSSPTSAELSNILPQFLTLLQSPSKINIPLPTLLGAITHFLSELDGTSLQRFTSALINSPSLWNQDDIGTIEIREAIRLAVPARISKITQQTKDVYFADVRKRRKAREWLDGLITSVLTADNDRGKLSGGIALLRGINNVPYVDWGKGRLKLEEMIVLSLAEKLENGTTEEIDGMTSVIPHIGIESLQALDMKKLITQVERSLYTAIDDDNNSSESITPDCARALARSLEVLYRGGPSSQKHARQRMMEFCEQIQKRAERFEGDWSHKIVKEDSETDPIWVKCKTTFFSFLLVASTMLDILLAETVISTSNDTENSDTVTSLPMYLLMTLGSFSYLIDASQGGFDNYHKVLYGSLDLLTSHGETDCISRLFDRLLRQGDVDNAKAGYILIIADELIHHLGKKEIDILLPLAERHVFRPNHKSSFEASHAFLLSLLRSSVENKESQTSQIAFFHALLPNYLNIITKQYTQKHITPDQFRQAFPIIVESASKRSPQPVERCLSSLSSLPPNIEIRQIQIAITPFIDSKNLPTYLDNLAQVILATEKGSEERIDLTQNAFEMVVRDLSDANKSIGIDWWIKWRNEFEGGRRKVGFIRSRL